MTQPKTHFVLTDCADSLCGRGARTTTDVYRVTCNLCRDKAVYSDALHEAAVARKAAFDAQVPRTFGEPWGSYGEIIACRQCLGVLFRRSERTCYGHYDNYVCADCGTTASRLTETGMSF